MTNRKQNVKRERTRTQQTRIPNANVNAYVIQTLNDQIAAMQRDLIECETVRKRTEADIKHIRGQIAALKRKAQAKR